MSYGRGVYGKAKYGVWSYKDSGAALSSAASVGATATADVQGAGAVVSFTDVVSVGAVLTSGVSALSAVATLTSDSIVENINGAHLASVSALAVSERRVQSYGAALVSQSEIETDPSVIVFGVPDPLTSVTDVGSNSARVTSAACALTALSQILAAGRGIYDPLAAEAESWNPPAPEISNWTPAAAGADVWQTQVVADSTWNPIAENAESWTETPVNG